MDFPDGTGTRRARRGCWGAGAPSSTSRAFLFGNCTILTGLPAYAEAEADTRGTCRGIDTDRFRALRRGALS
jgi:hypothetical protein